MTYFASENAITEQDMNDQPGWVEIDAGQYAAALDALLSGWEVAIDDGAMVIREQRPSAHHEWKNGEWVYRAPEPKGPTPQQQWDVLRAERDVRLSTTDWIVQRHAEELALEMATTLTPEQHTDLLTYRQALRDLPENTTDPAAPVWPVSPAP